jgi:hypothetical protein
LFKNSSSGLLKRLQIRGLGISVSWYISIPLRPFSKKADL